jgi:hypothetical protein
MIDKIETHKQLENYLREVARHSEGVFTLSAIARNSVAYYKLRHLLKVKYSGIEVIYQGMPYGRVLRLSFTSCAH